MNYLIARGLRPHTIKALPAQKKKLFDYSDKLDWVEGGTSSTLSSMKPLLKLTAKFSRTWSLNHYLNSKLATPA